MEKPLQSVYHSICVHSVLTIIIHIITYVYIAPSLIYKGSRFLKNHRKKGSGFFCKMGGNPCWGGDCLKNVFMTQFFSQVGSPPLWCFTTKTPTIQFLSSLKKNFKRSLSETYKYDHTKFAWYGDFQTAARFLGKTHFNKSVNLL